MGGLGLLVTEKNFRRIIGYRDLWSVAAILGRETKTKKNVCQSENVA
jgi:hypothetical protein